MRYANYPIRLLAYLFDQLLISLIPLFILLYIVNTCQNLWLGLLWLIWELIFLQWLLSLLYQIITFKYLNGSFGKLLAGLRIEKEDGSTPTFGDCLMRFAAGYTVSGLCAGLGFFWILKDPKKKAFHDHFAGTVVVKKSSPLPLFLGLIFIMVISVIMIINIITTGTRTGLFQKSGQEFMGFTENIKKIFEDKPKTTPLPKKYPTSPTIPPLPLKNSYTL